MSDDSSGRNTPAPEKIHYHNLNYSIKGLGKFRLVDLTCVLGPQKFLWSR